MIRHLTRRALPALLLAASTVAFPTRAAVLVADFNDLTANASITGSGGGTGWTGNWSGSGSGKAVAGDLTSALYNVPQTGTALHLQNANADVTAFSPPATRQNFRTPAASPTGTVWFSLLAQVVKAGDRAGISFDAPTTSPFNNVGNFYAYLEGSTLDYSFGAGTAGSVATSAAVGSTALIVGRITINPGAAADPVSIWVNPNLIANPDITAYTPAFASTTTTFDDTIARVGAVASQVDSGTGGSGNVDNIRISDGGGNAAQAYTDVTGVTVPEPASAALLALAATGALVRRRR